MKNLIKITTLLVCIFMISGCGSSSGSKTTTVCKHDDHIGTMSVDSTTTIEASGDDITKQTIDVTYDCKDYVDQMDNYLTQLKANDKTYDGIKGLTIKYTKKDTKLIVSYVIDVEKANLKTLKKKGLITSDSDDVDSISLKDTVKALKKNDVTCKETKK
ncbi:MAG: DUF1307 domain-containing protein [Thomasclavelia sp.]|nr:DUF1307 domain-containing protein [Thomasclavelia sp.]